MEEESNGRVEHDVAVEIFVGLVQHASVVAGVDVVPPAILGGVDVEFGHAQQGHLLVVPVALDPAHPVTAWVAPQPDDAGAKPQVHRAPLVRGHHRLLAAPVDHRVALLCGFHRLRHLRREAAQPEAKGPGLEETHGSDRKAPNCEPALRGK